MKVITFYFLNCFLVFLLIPLTISTYIENEEVKSSKANPLVVGKLLEKLDKYQKEILKNEKNNDMQSDNIFEAAMKVKYFNYFKEEY